MSNTRSELGALLKAARARVELSQRDVERESGVSNAYLSQIESGKIQEPSPNILYKLADLYGIAYAELLKAAGYPLPGGKGKRQSAFRPANSLGRVTATEEIALKEYLEFLRAKKRNGKK